MTRPLYESDFDRRVEEIVAGRISELWDAQLEKLPISYYLDYIAMRNGVAVGFVEVRRRSFRWGDFDDVMLALNKWRHGCEISRDTGLPAIFVVIDRDDDIRWTAFTDKYKPLVEIGGRNQIRDKADIEPVVKIPLERFKKLV